MPRICHAKQLQQAITTFLSILFSSYPESLFLHPCYTNIHGVLPYSVFILENLYKQMLLTSAYLEVEDEEKNVKEMTLEDVYLRT
jgi:hypothetical protein